MKILFLPGHHYYPSARFRILQFVKPLKELGHDIKVRVIYPNRYWSSSLKNKIINKYHNRLGSLMRLASAFWVLRDAYAYDVIFMNRDLLPETRITFVEPWLYKRNPRLIFDFDDAIFLGSRGDKLRKILPYFAWIVAGNNYLASFAKEVNFRVSIWPSVVDTEYYNIINSRKPGPPRIGWTGSKFTLRDCFPLIKESMIELAKKEDFELVIISDAAPKIEWPGVRWSFIPWSSETEAEDLQKIDIGIMPLRDEPFERGKCGMKAILYMSSGIPALVSPIGVNKDIVIHEETGFHCVSDSEWISYLRLLIRDENLRKHMGKAARDHVEKNYSIKSLLPKMLEVFAEVSKL